MSKKGKPRCAICGRGLRDPISIAAGVGPVCGGRSGTGRGRRGGRSVRRSGGRRYDSGMHGTVGELPMVQEVENKPDKKIVPWAVQLDEDDLEGTNHE